MAEPQLECLHVHLALQNGLFALLAAIHPLKNGAPRVEICVQDAQSVECPTVILALAPGLRSVHPLPGSEHVVWVLICNLRWHLQPAHNGLVPPLPLFQPVFIHSCAHIMIAQSQSGFASFNTKRDAPTTAAGRFVTLFNISYAASRERNVVFAASATCRDNSGVSASGYSAPLPLTQQERHALSA